MRHHLKHSPVYLLLILLLLVQAYGLFLKLDTNKTFELLDAELLTNRMSYIPGERILLRFKYCSKKDQNITGRFILQDGIKVDGEVKILPVYEGCGTMWLEMFDVPAVAYSSAYTISGTMSYELNPLKTVELEVISKEFEVRNETRYLIDQFDLLVPLI